MNNFNNLLPKSFDFTAVSQNKIMLSLAVIFALWILRLIVLKFVFQRSEDTKTHYHWRKISLYINYFVGFLLIGRIWYSGFSSLSTFIGLFTAGLTIALKDLVVNLAGWGFIMIRKPFQVGDRIQIGEFAGDVIDLRIFQFTLMEIGNWVDAEQSTGRILHIPNGRVITEVSANYSKGFQYIWNEIPVLVTFESDWERAESILEAIVLKHAEHLSKAAEEKVKEASRRYMIFFNTLTPKIYVSVRDCGVLLTIRYLCNPRKRRGTEEAIWKDILREFSDCDNIDFAYPTQRFYNNITEGKPPVK